MSRIRSVHPGFFRDDRLVPCSAFARLLFIGLGVEADDKGIFEWKPVTIKMSVFPGDNVDVGELLTELVEADAVRQFEAGGKRYGAIRNFRKYQKPKTPNDVHPMADGIAEYVSLPPKGEAPFADEDQFPQNGEKSFQMDEGGGKMEEEKQKPTVSAKKPVRWEAGQKVPADWIARAKVKFPGVEPFRLQSQIRQFEDYWPGQQGKSSAKTEWETAFIMWMRKAFPEFEVVPGDAGAPLVVLSPDDPDFLAVQAMRGQTIQVGKSGKMTFKVAEVEQARKAAA